MSNCKVIALTNQKGGVGKTTTAVNLGVSLVQQGKKVLLIDADAQANLTMALGYNRPDDIPITLSTVMQNIIDDKTLDVSQGIIHHSEGVDLLPSNIELSGFEVRLINAMSRERVLKIYVNEVKKNYDYVLIDCMPSLGMITINALAAADSVIIPTQPHYLSAKGLELLLRSVSMVKRQINPKLRIDGILMTMVMPRTVAENSNKEAFNTYIGNITSVNVNGTDYAARGKGSVKIIDKDGTLVTDAAPFKDVAAGTEFQITVTSTGYTTPLTFTYKVPGKTPAPSEDTTKQVSTDALEKAIKVAGALNESDYTADSWKALQSALDEADTALKEKKNQDTVDKATEQLNKAISALVKKDAGQKANGTNGATGTTGTNGTSGKSGKTGSTSNTKSGKAAKTGDPSGMFAWLGLAVTSLGAGIGGFSLKRKKREDEE